MGSIKGLKSRFTEYSCVNVYVNDGVVECDSVSGESSKVKLKTWGVRVLWWGRFSPHRGINGLGGP